MFLGIITSNGKMSPTVWVPAGVKINAAAPLDYANWDQDCQCGIQGDCAKCWRHEGQGQCCLAGAGARLRQEGLPWVQALHGGCSWRKGGHIE